MRFNIENVSDKALDLIVVYSATDFFDLKLPKSVKAHETIHGTIKLRKNVLDKSFEKSFTIEVNDESKSRFTVPVKRSLGNATIPIPEDNGGH